MEWFSALRPVLSMDELSGKPSISLERSDQRQESATTREIFRILNEQARTIFLAIDEFQQIATFEDARMDAVLRTELQRSTKVRCIFSGSQRHNLLDLFNSAGRPFYCSADQVELKKIDRATYAEFARANFKRYKRTLKLEDAGFCYDLCRGHTYYLQVMFNRLFADSRPLERDKIVEIMLANQWDLFAAISKEGDVDTPTGAIFTKKYDLPSSAALVLALQALIDRELIYITEHTTVSGKPVYAPYDPFMAAWFKYR